MRGWSLSDFFFTLVTANGWLNGVSGLGGLGRAREAAPAGGPTQATLTRLGKAALGPGGSQPSSGGHERASRGPPSPKRGSLEGGSGPCPPHAGTTLSALPLWQANPTLSRLTDTDPGPQHPPACTEGDSGSWSPQRPGLLRLAPPARRARGWRRTGPALNEALGARPRFSPPPGDGRPASLGQRLLAPGPPPSNAGLAGRGA